MDNFAFTVPSFETLKIFFLNPWTWLFLFVFAMIEILRSIKDFWDGGSYYEESLDWFKHFFHYFSPFGLIMAAYQLSGDCILSEDLSFVERFLIFISYYSFALWIISHLVRSIWL